MRRITNEISCFTGIKIYKTLTAPHYEYCATLLINLDKECLKLLQKTQNRAMRAILRVDRYIRINNMLEALCFLSIEQRIKYSVCILIYKMLSNLTPDYLSRTIEKFEHKYETRNKDNLVIKKVRTSTAEKTLNIYGFQIYNN